MDYFFLYLSMISEEQKKARYQRLHEQASELLRTSPSAESAFATLNALLYHKVSYIFWVGFYLRRNQQLIVSAYQGPLACQVLPYPKGICWQCVLEETPVIVPDVHAAPDHITCDLRAKSEIVLPLFDSHSQIIGVLDIDSDSHSAFTEADKSGLQSLLKLLPPLINNSMSIK